MKLIKTLEELKEYINDKSGVCGNIPDLKYILDDPYGHINNIKYEDKEKFINDASQFNNFCLIFHLSGGNVYLIADVID